MAEEVKVPISLEITDIDTSQITSGKISKRLSGVKKAISSVFTSAGNTKFGQSLTKAANTMRDLSRQAQRVSTEERKAAQEAWRRSEAYKAAVQHNKDLERQIQEIRTLGSGRQGGDMNRDALIAELEKQKVSTDMPEIDAYSRLRQQMDDTKNTMKELRQEYEQLQRDQEHMRKNVAEHNEETEHVKELLAAERERHAELKKQRDAARKSVRSATTPETTASAQSMLATKQAELDASSKAIENYELKLFRAMQTDRKFAAVMQQNANDAAKLKERYTALGSELNKLKTKFLGLSIVRVIMGGIKSSTDEATEGNKKLGRAGHSTTRSMSKGFHKLSKNIMMFGFGFRSAYYLVKRLRNIIKQDFGTMAGSFDEINGPLSDLLTSFNRLKGSLGTALQPLISAIVPTLKTLVDYLSDAADKVGEFFAALTGQDYIYKAKANQKDFAASINGTSKVADYDQLKVIGDTQDVEYEKTAIDAEKVAEAHSEMFNSLKDFGAVLSELGQKLSPLISTILTAIEPIAAVLIDIVGVVVSLIAEILGSEAVKSFLEGVASIISRIGTYALDVFTKLSPVIADVIDKVLPVVTKALDAIWPLMEGIMSAAMELLPTILDLISPLLDMVILILDPIIDLCAPLLKILGTLIESLGIILAPIIALLKPLIELINAVLEPIIENLMMIIGPILDALADWLSWLLPICAKIQAVVMNTVVKVIQRLVDKIKAALGVFTTGFKTIRKGLSDVWDFVKGIINAILGGIESLVNGVVNGINAMVRALNKLSFDTPDWLPPPIGGKKFGFNLKEVSSIKIPKLAQGAVLPPNKEFLATLGDQRHGTNIEAPLDTIKQALIEALAEAGGTRQPIVLKLDGKTVAQVVWEQNEKRYKQTGKFGYSM